MSADEVQEDECDLTNKLADQSKHLQFLRKQVVQIKRQLKNQKSMKDESQLRRDQQASLEQEEQRLELEKLNDLLTVERQKFDGEKMARIQLQTELEKSRSQLGKVKTARECYMKKEEEMSVMLLKLQEQSESLHTSTDHQMVEMKKKEERLIQDVWEAQHIMARLAEELQGEKNLNLVLQQKLERMTVSHEELSKECETAVHQSDALKEKLEMLINAHAEKEERDEQVIQQLQAEQEELRRALEAQMDSAHQTVDKKPVCLLGLCQEQNIMEKCADEAQVGGYSMLMENLDRLTISHLQERLQKVLQSHEKETKDNEQLIEELRTEREELKRRIQQLTRPAEPLEEEQRDQGPHEEDADVETLGEDSCRQEISLRTEDDSSPATLPEESEDKELLPPVHRSMRRIRRFLGLRRKRQKTPTY